jgi:hypothetical protein
MTPVFTLSFWFIQSEPTWMIFDQDNPRKKAKNVWYLMWTAGWSRTMPDAFTVSSWFMMAGLYTVYDSLSWNITDWRSRMNGRLNISECVKGALKYMINCLYVYYSVTSSKQHARYCSPSHDISQADNYDVTMLHRMHHIFYIIYYYI